LCDERSGDRDALLLSTRELVWRVPCALSKPDGAERLYGALAPLALANPHIDQWELDVLYG